MAGPTPAAAGPPDTSTSVRGRSSPRPDRRAIAAASQGPNGPAELNIPSVLFQDNASARATPAASSLPSNAVARSNGPPAAVSVARRDPEARRAADAARRPAPTIVPAVTPLAPPMAQQLTAFLTSLSKEKGTPRIQKRAISAIVITLPTREADLLRLRSASVGYGRDAHQHHGKAICEKVAALVMANASSNPSSNAVTPSPQAPLSTRPERALSGRRGQTPLCIDSNPNIVVLPTRNLVGDSFEALLAKQFPQGPVSLASQRVKNNFDLRRVKDNVDHIRGANRLSLEDAMRAPDDQDIMLLIPAYTYVANGKKWRPLPLPHRWLEHDTISSQLSGRSAGQQVIDGVRYEVYKGTTKNTFNAITRVGELATMSENQFKDEIKIAGGLYFVCTDAMGEAKLLVLYQWMDMTRQKYPVAVFGHVPVLPDYPYSLTRL